MCLKCCNRMANSVDAIQTFSLEQFDLGLYRLFRINTVIEVYSKCPKILNTKVSDKMTYANCADPDQTSPERAV